MTALPRSVRRLVAKRMEDHDSCWGGRDKCCDPIEADLKAFALACYTAGRKEKAREYLKAGCPWAQGDKEAD